MRQSSPPSRKRNKTLDSQVLSSRNGSKIRRQEHDRDQLESEEKRAYVDSWIQNVSLQSKCESGLLEGKEVKEVSSWRPHNLPMSKSGPNYRHGSDHNQSSWVLRDSPLRSPAQQCKESHGLSSSSSTFTESSLQECDHTSESGQEESIYEKRPRAKTKLGRYDSKKRSSHTSKNKPRHKIHRKSGLKRKRQGKQRSLKRTHTKAQPLRSRKDIMDSFLSSAIPNTTTRVTLKPNLTAGLFLNGRGSDSAAEMHSRVSESTSLENAKSEQKPTKHAQDGVGRRRRKDLDEVADFFAHDHLDKQRYIETKDATVAQSPANPRCSLPASHNMPESCPRQESTENPPKEGTAPPRSSDPEVRGSSEIKHKSSLKIPIPLQTPMMIDDSESDGTCIPTPTLRELFPTGVFDYRDSKKDEEKVSNHQGLSDGTTAGEGANLSGHSEGLKHHRDRNLTSDQSPGRHTQPYKEDLRQDPEQGYSSPDLYVKQCPEDNDELTSSASHLFQAGEENKSDVPMQEQFRSANCCPVWMASSENTTLPTYQHVREPRQIFEETRPLWATHMPFPSRLPLPMYHGQPRRLWDSQERLGFEYNIASHAEGIPPPQVPVLPISVPIENFAAQPPSGFFLPEDQTDYLLFEGTDTAGEFTRLDHEFGGRCTGIGGSTESTSELIRRIEYETLEEKAVESRRVDDSALREYNMDTGNSSAFALPDSGQVLSYLGQVPSRHPKYEGNISRTTRTETAGRTGELDMAEFWRPNRFL